MQFDELYNTLREIGKSVYSDTPFHLILETIVKQTSNLFKAKGATVGVLNFKTKFFEWGASYGLNDRCIFKDPIPTEKVIKELNCSQRVIFIRDIQNDPRIFNPKEIWEEGIRLIIDAPLMHPNEMIGVLRIYFDQARGFSEEEVRYIALIAERAASVIQKAKLLEMQKSRYDQLALQAEKLSALGRMAAGIAHEINNPLGGILLYGTRLLKKASPEGLFREGLEVIVQEAQRCKKIIQGLLEFSRTSEPKTTLMNINNIIHKVVNLLENEFRLHHIQLELETAHPLPEIQIDEAQIEQILVNLTLNAIQAIEDKGTIKICTSQSVDEKYVVIEVIDTGCGIPPENLSKIFEPFFSTKPKGTGLGLAVSYGIVQKHGGNIYAQSTLGEGSRFVVELPIPFKGSSKGEKKEHETSKDFNNR